MAGICALGATAAAVGAIRVHVASGDTVEALAERHYGDRRRAPVIRAMNRIAENQQPAAGVTLKLPGPVLHTVQGGETLDTVAQRFLAGEGGAELLAEANGLARGARIVPGQVLTIFAEIEVQTQGRSAEDLATVFLLDADLGARIRRYNGSADGGRLPASTVIPLVGLEPVAATPDAPSTNAVVSGEPLGRPRTSTPTPSPPTAPPTTMSGPAPPVPTTPSPIVTGKPSATPTRSAEAPALDLQLPVTGKRATLAGFSHAMHTPMTIGGAAVGCLVCHERTAPDAVTHRPPATRNCLLCHKTSDEMPAALRAGLPRTLPMSMNHKSHVTEAQVACTACHAHAPERALGLKSLGHDACVSCHSPEGGQAPLVSGDPSARGCTGCHGTVETDGGLGQRGRYLRSHLIRPAGRAGDVSFTHVTHRAFSPGGSPENGPALACVTCHTDVPMATTRSLIGQVPMQGCVECHRQANAVGMHPPESCQGCHLHHRAGLMPRSDVVQKKPIDHTAFFRRHHAEAARTEAALCASCHVGTSPDGNRCDTCHVQTRPRDHTAGFRDKVHGRQSQIDPTRCQTCHRAERCESCHREVPRSHFPLQTWVEQGVHGTRGRLEMSACLTCHRFETACARCHTAVAN